MTFASEFNPDDDIAELMGLTPQAPAGESIMPSSEERESDTRSLFERDLDAFKVMIAGWQKAMETQMVATRDEVPAGYHMTNNHDFSPYDQGLAQNLELKQRGAGYVICHQAFMRDSDDLIEKYIAVHSNGAPYFYASINEFIEAELLFAVASNHISSHDYLHPQPWGKRKNEAINWARQQGIAESAFMTSFLLRSLEIESAEQRFPGMHSWKDSSDRDLYEKLAGEVDEDGHRKFVPLSIEQFAGLAVAPLYQAFGANPELNEKYGLTKPFPTAAEPEAI
jgi:hypothetical protein